MESVWVGIVLTDLGGEFSGELAMWFLALRTSPRDPLGARRPMDPRWFRDQATWLLVYFSWLSSWVLSRLQAPL